MTNEQLRNLEDQVVNCHLLHAAIRIIESIRDHLLPDGLTERWIAEMKEEAGYQISQHDEDRDSLLDNADVDAPAHD